MLKATFFIVALLIISPGPARAGGAQDDAPDVRGVASRVERKRADSPDMALVGTLLIEGVKEPDTKVDKALVRVSDETAVYDLRGGGRRRVTFDALRAGQRVEARFTGPVQLSYPVRTGASEVVILEEAPGRPPVDPSHPKGVAGARGWGYHRSASADFDGDGASERVFLIANVALRRGRPVWDDAQVWQVYVEEPGGGRTYVYSRSVQLGHLELLVTPAEGGGARRLVIIERTPHALGVYEVSYRGPGEAHAAELVRRLLDPSVPLAEPRAAGGRR